jgi:cell division protein FtsZ
MNIKLELPQLTDLKPRLTVIGVGGAGCNAINNMIAAGLTGVEFVAANTDAQTLEASGAEHRIQLGINLTEGLGAGANPEIGSAAAEEAIDEIKSQISGSHMVFLAAGMGGGTGTGAISVIARASREMGILTVGVVTKPFQFEGSRRMRLAENGLKELRANVDTLIAIPNQNLFRVANEKTTFAEAFLLADQVLYSGVACIVDLIVKEGLINLDFADVRAIMSNMGTAMMGTGEGSGDRRAILAAEEAIANPLLDDVSLQGARGLLLSITGGPNLTLYEVDEAASRVRKEVDPEANIIVGATFDDKLDERVRVSIVASGMANANLPAGEAPGDGFNIATQPNLAGETAQQRPGLPPRPPTPPPVPQNLSQAGGRAKTHEPFPPLPSSRATPAAPAPMPHAANGLPAQASGRPDTATSVPAVQPPPVQGRAVPENTSALWRSPEGVTIEAGTNALDTPAVQAAPSPQMPHGSGRTDDADRFEPRQTQQIHRRTQMPGVEDFPAVGQRDYYAKQSGSDPHSEAAGTGGPQRKPGLFERLAGLGRRQSDSLQEHDTGKPEGVTQCNIPEEQASDAPLQNRGQSVHNTLEQPAQPVDNNEFYDREKRRS